MLPNNLGDQQTTGRSTANKSRGYWQNVFGIKEKVNGGFLTGLFYYIKIKMQNCKQEMPPPNGYPPIKYKRIPLKPGLSPKFKLFMVAVASGLSYAWFRETKWQITKDRLEDWSAHSALMPMILAETDRMLLRQLKRNRDAEERIMKDVEGWEVGKYKNLPVYSSFGPDEFFRPSLIEYFMHENEKEFKKYRNVFQYN